jgi:hypothetical protein
VIVNTKNWYSKGTDLWAEVGNEIPFGRENLLRGFGKECMRSAMHHHSAKDYLCFKRKFSGMRDDVARYKEGTS